jgi:hypothetical protein
MLPHLLSFSKDQFEDRFYETFINRVELLHHDLEKASERCRLMLYIITLGSMLISVVNFNANVSWDTKINAKDRLLLSQELNTVPPFLLRRYNDSLAMNLGRKDLKYFNDHAAKEIRLLCDSLDAIPNLPGKEKKQHALDTYLSGLTKNNLLIDNKTYFDFFIKHQQFTIPLIGLSCSVSDMFLLCSIFFIIILSYNNFNLRREDRIVFRIYKSFLYIKKYDDALTKFGISTIDEYKRLSIKVTLLDMIFQGTVNSFVFSEPASFGKDYWSEEDDSKKNRFVRIRKKASTYIIQNRLSRWIWRNIINNIIILWYKILDVERPERDPSAKRNYVARFIKSTMDFFPFFSLILLCWGDFHSYFMRKEFFTPQDNITIFIIEGIGLICSAICFNQCIIARKTTKTTERTLDKMYQVVLTHRKELKDKNKAQSGTASNDEV